MSDEAIDKAIDALSALILEQGSDAWLQARVGSLGASVLHEAVAKTKAGAYGASRQTRMTALAIERVSGKPRDGFVSASMLQGKEREPIARQQYIALTAFDSNAGVVTECGLFRHPSIVGTHASPDGLVGSDGMIEIKCPEISAHMETLLWDSIPDKYIVQMQWQMACTGRLWCDYVSFNPDVVDGELFVERVERDDKRIASLEIEVTKFVMELDELVARYRAKIKQRKEGNGESK